jgi:hypothetical protein
VFIYFSTKGFNMYIFLASVPYPTKGLDETGSGSIPMYIARLSRGQVNEMTPDRLNETPIASNKGS